MTVNELRKLLPNPNLHQNTVSTQVRMLESNGFLAHEKEGMGYRYHAAISQDEYSNNAIGRIVMHCFERSYFCPALSWVTQAVTLSSLFMTDRKKKLYVR